MATTHTATQIGTGHTTSMNGKSQHTHIPRIYSGKDTTFNSTMIDGGGMLECGLCGEVLQDTSS